MNPALAQFMKMAATTICIAALIFVVAFAMVKGEATKYKTNVTDQNAPALTTLTTP
jgi:hypothetical protein